MPSDLSPPPAPRCIGVVGGVGPQAGLDLAQKVLAATAASRDQDHLPLLLHSLPRGIPDRTDFLLGRGGPNPGHALADVAEGLVRAGAEVIGIPCNTAHAPAIFGVVRERIAGRAGLVHMIEEVGAALAREYPAMRKVGILSTTGTHVTRLYPDALEPLGYRTLQLPMDLQERLVHPAIYDPAYGVKAVSDPVSEQAVRDLSAGVAHLVEAGAEAVVLACTEIPLALSGPALHGVPLLDPTSVLARALVRESAPDRLVG